MFPLGLRGRLAVCYGGAISLALSWAGYALLMKLPGSDSRAFIKIVLGGMAARLIAALALLALGIGVFALPAAELVGSCLLSYVVMIFLEHRFALPELRQK